MKWFAWLLLFIHIVALPHMGRAGDDDRVLYIYTWEDYFDPYVVRAFEQAYGCRVDFDYFDSYDTMYERIRNGDTGYDLMTPSADLSAELEKQGLLMNLNRRLIPNMRHLDTDRLTVFADLEMRYHAPYTWSINVIGYNKKMVSPDMLGGWDIFTTPGFARRAAVMNDPRYVIGAALRHLGHSLNSTNPAELEAAAEVLDGWKKSVATFGVNEPRFMLEREELSFIQAFSGDMAKAVKNNPDLGFYVPREGSILNMDFFVIPVDAENSELAHAFINHMFDPKMAARNMESNLYYMPNRAAVAQLRPEFKNHPFLFFPQEDIDRAESLRSVGAALPLYEEIWESLLINND